MRSRLLALVAEGGWVQRVNQRITANLLPITEARLPLLASGEQIVFLEGEQR